MTKFVKNSDVARDPYTRGPSTKTRPSLGSYKVEQRQIHFRERVFHFVSYQDQDLASVPIGQPSAKWYLMSEGTRWEVMPQHPGEAVEDIDRRLVEWLERTVT